MSIKSEAERIQANIAAAYTAASAKGATMPAEQNSDNLAEAVESIPTGGGGAPVHVEEKDVNFWDYDGTLLYSYTLAEAQALAELPPLPPAKRDFYEPDCWNWTLQELKDLECPVSVAAIMKTVDDKTYVVINIPPTVKKTVTMRVKLWYQVSAVLIDWGDGSNPENVVSSVSSGTDNRTITHEYPEYGEYTISLAGTGTVDMGHGQKTTSFITAETIVGGRVEDSVITEIYIGKYIRAVAYSIYLNPKLKVAQLNNRTTEISTGFFPWCTNMEMIGIPPTVTKINGYAFEDMYHLKTISLPPSVQTISSELVWNGSSRKITIPPSCATSGGRYTYVDEIYLANGVKTIVANMAYDNRRLRHITIPQSITDIGASAFGYCNKLSRIKFLPVTPPTVANASAFNGIPTDCVVEVPAASFSEYQNATNYSGISAQMIGV